VSAAARFREAVVGAARGLELVAGWILLIVAIGVTANAIARYGFGTDLAIVTETGGFVFLIVTFLALTSAYFAGQHVSVEMLELVGSKRFVSFMYGYVIPFLSLVFMVSMTVASLIMTMRYFKTGRVTIGMNPMPYWMFMAVVPLGSGLFSLAIVSDLIERFRGNRSVQPPDPAQSADDGL